MKFTRNQEQEIIINETIIIIINEMIIIIINEMIIIDEMIIIKTKEYMFCFVLSFPLRSQSERGKKAKQAKQAKGH